jgi:hypothetical protein
MVGLGDGKHCHKTISVPSVCDSVRAVRKQISLTREGLECSFGSGGVRKYFLAGEPGDWESV